MPDLKKSLQLAAMCALLLASCTQTRLEQALTLAGDNRPELEKVLRHYSEKNDDGLKLKAATFLIENAPYHGYFAGKGVDNFRRYADSVLYTGTATEQTAEQFVADRSNIHYEWDIEKLTSEFLIAHIDNAFTVFQYPWNKNLSFDDFCEYVLPYRLDKEQIEDWMPFFRSYNAATIDELLKTGETDVFVVVKKMFDSLNVKPVSFTSNPSMKIDLSPSDFVKMGDANCRELSFIGAYSYRSIGLPVNYDYTMQWANRSISHNWNSIYIDSVNYHFAMLDAVPFGEHLGGKPNDRPGKIYRRMFSFQPESLFAQPESSKEEVPPVFLDPLIKDVSELYFDGVNVDMELTIPFGEKRRLAYLAVFDNQKWVAVAWSRIKRNTVSFKNIEKGCAYVVAYYGGNQLHPATDPFSVNKEGEITVLKPGKSVCTVELKRKYPDFDPDVYKVRMPGGKFQVSDNPDFTNARTIHTIDNLEETKPYYIDINDNGRYKYFRYLSTPGGHVFMAEVEVFDSSGAKLEGNVIGSEGSFNNNGLDKHKVFDGDVLTYFDAPYNEGCWAGLAFDSPQTIGSLTFVPKNDDNFIQNGEHYELFYCLDGKFISLGERVGDETHVLHYDNVPGTALLLLRNHTKGKEERIFTWENERQVWW
jgi:hypothetical protein